MLRLGRARLAGIAGRCAAALIALLAGSQGFAQDVVTQIVRDGSIGPDASVQPEVIPVDDAGVLVLIGEDLGQRSGGTLFHSFKTFDLGPKDRVAFGTSVNFPDPDVAVIARITGGNPSRIFGSLQSSSPLYFLNPAGVLFGPGAQLGSTGFFAFSTADELRFANGATFGAGRAETPPPALSVDQVVEFGFRHPTGSIVLQGSGATTFSPENSQAFFAGLLSFGSVALLAGTPGTRLVLDRKVVSFQDQLVGFSVLERGQTAGPGSDVGLIRVEDRPLILSPASVGLFYGESIEIRNSALLAENQIPTVSDGAALQLISPGSVRIVDSRLGTVFTTEDPTTVPFVFAKGATRLSIAGGSVEVLRSELFGEDQLRIEAGTSLAVTQSRLLSNFGGNFLLRGGTSLSLDGSLISNQGMPVGVFFPFGLIDLQAPLLEILNSTVSTTAGDGGPPVEITTALDIRIVADRFRLSGSTLSSQVFPRPRLFTVGQPVDPTEFSRAGTISILANDIEILDHSSLLSSALGNPNPLFPADGLFPDIIRGSAGQILLQSFGSVRIADSTLNTQVDTQSNQLRGSIQIFGRDVDIQGASISAEAISGDAGNLVVQSSSALGVRGSSLTSSAARDGSAGAVAISGVAVDVDGSSILSSNDGTGSAGTVNVAATSLSLTGASRIATQAKQGPAPGQPADGNIEIQVSDGLLITGRSSIDASVDNGQGGDIRIGSPDFVVLRDGSRILAQTRDGNGGRVDITARSFLADPTSVVSADAAVGTSGTVDLRSPDVDLQGSIEGLSAEFLNVSTLLRPSCEAREESGASASLYVARASGLPVSPEEWLLAFDAPATPPTNPTPAESAASQGPITAALDLARAQQASGAYGPSLATLTTALSRARTDEDAAGFAALLAAAGNAQQALGERAAAEELLTRGSRAAQRERGSPLASWIENDLGNHYAAEGASERARAAYAEAIASAERTNDALVAAKALANAARLALESDRADEAMGLLERADERLQSLPDEVAKAGVLVHLGRTRALQAERATDTRLHDASLLRAYALFQSASELSAKLGDRRLRSYALGNLGSLYLSERRYGEALALTREALREAERAQSPDPLYRWHAQEGRILWAQGKAQPAIEAYRRAVALLEETRRESRARYGERADSFNRMLAPVYMDLVDALLRGADSIEDPAHTEALLIEARATVEQLKAAELRNYLRDDCSTQLEARTTSLDSLATGAAVVYPIALPDRLELLVRLPAGLKRYTLPVGAAAIEAEARQLRRLLQDRSSAGYRPVARQLYDWLVRPYADRLAADKVETLVFVPSGALRSIPMSALHDGQHFLAERFAVATAPGLSLVDPRPFDLAGATPLLGGVSEAVQEFAPLGSVPRELSAIQELFGGKLLLDDGFQVETIRTAIRESRPTLVHFASHAVFTGDPSTSFLLTHDGRMTLRDVVQALGPTRYRTDPVELLVLSACDTAVGDDRAALGLAGVAVRSGARSALGSLWAISDEATYPMIVSFYKSLHEPGTSRAAALRKAQLEMLGNEKFSHPFFWSTFVLISNWL